MTLKENISLVRANPVINSYNSGIVTEHNVDAYANLFYPYIYDNGGDPTNVSLTIEVFNKNESVDSSFPQSKWVSEDRNMGDLLTGNIYWGFGDTHHTSKKSQSLSNAWCFGGQKILFYIAQKGHLSGYLNDTWVYCKNNIQVSAIDVINGEEQLLYEFDAFESDVDDSGRYFSWGVPQNNYKPFSSYGLFGMVVLKITSINEYYTDAARTKRLVGDFISRDVTATQLLIYSASQEASNVSNVNENVFKESISADDNFIDIFNKSLFYDINNVSPISITNEQKRSIIADQIAVLFMSQHPVLNADYVPGKISGYGVSQITPIKKNVENAIVYARKYPEIWEMARDRLYGMSASYKLFNYTFDIETIVNDYEQSIQLIRDPVRCVLIDGDGVVDNSWSVNGIMFNPYILSTSHAVVPRSYFDKEYNILLNSASVDIGNLSMDEISSNGSSRLVMVSFDVLYGENDISRIRYKIITKNCLKILEYEDNTGKTRNHIFDINLDSPPIRCLNYPVDEMRVQIDIEDRYGFVTSYYSFKSFPFDNTQPVLHDLKIYQDYNGGGIVIIEYVYDAMQAIDPAQLHVQFSIDGGEIWSSVATTSLKGDFGHNVLPGHRKMYWSPAEDLTEDQLSSLDYILCRLTLYDVDGNKNYGDSITGAVPLNLVKPKIKLRRVPFDEEQEMYVTSSSSSFSSSSYSTSSASSLSSLSESSSSSWDITSSSSTSSLDEIEPLIPIMTSDVTPAPYVASASNVFWPGFTDAWMAYRSDIYFLAWRGFGNSGWLKIDMGVNNQKMAQHYSVKASGHSAPKDWTLEGSNDNISWSVLDARTNQTGWTFPSETRYYMDIGNITSYRYYRINISNNNGDFTTGVIKLQLYQDLNSSSSSSSSDKSSSSSSSSGAMIKFIVLSDQHNYTGSSIYDTSAYFRGACEKIATLNTDFMVVVGDFVQPQNTAWTIEQYIDPNYVWYPVIGNHECESSGAMSWIRAKNAGGISLPYIVRGGPENAVETIYSFDYKQCHFIVINEYYNGLSDCYNFGTNPGYWQGNIDDPLYRWLINDLELNDKPYIFIFGHEPAYPQPDMDNGRERHMTDSLNKSSTAYNRDRFWNLLNDYGVVAYFNGHTHNYSQIKEGSVWQIDTGHTMGDGDLGAMSTFLKVIVDHNDIHVQVYRRNPSTLIYEKTRDIPLLGEISSSSSSVSTSSYSSNSSSSNSSSSTSSSESINNFSSSSSSTASSISSVSSASSISSLSNSSESSESSSSSSEYFCEIYNFSYPSVEPYEWSDDPTKKYADAYAQIEYTYLDKCPLPGGCDSYYGRYVVSAINPGEVDVHVDFTTSVAIDWASYVFIEGNGTCTEDIENPGTYWGEIELTEKISGDPCGYFAVYITPDNINTYNYYSAQCEGT